MLDSIYQAIDPIALDFGIIQIRWYGLAYLFGFIVGGFLIYRVARHWKLKIKPDDILMLVVAVAFGVIVGARLFYVLFYNLPYYLENPAHIIMFNEGGMSFHGGLVGAIAFGALACRYIGLSFTTMLDLGAIAAPVGLFFGRVANFINGELWGKPTDLPWGVAFESGGYIMRHPSQLYEALLEGVVLFIVLYALSRRLPPRPKGTFIGVFLIGYGIARFIVEFVRVPDVQLGYLYGFLTMGQLLTLPVFLAGVLILVLLKPNENVTPLTE